MFESHVVGYVKDTCFADSLMLYGSLRAKKRVIYLLVAKNLKKSAILGLFFENFAICAVFIIGYVQDTYLGQQLGGYRE